MIVKASQRGFAGELARHLLNTRDNDHVTVHKVVGFGCDDVKGSLLEIEAISQGTRCKQPIFQASFNPPADQNVSTKDFEKAIKVAGERLGLDNQPHVIIFHEKNGRRHAHCAWSRIDAEKMRAINLPHFKNKLVQLSKELYIEHDWKMPQGLLDKSLRNPLNYSLQEWQQAKRSGGNPKLIKQAIQSCWQQSSNQKGFTEKLSRYGMALARGDKRVFVVVDFNNEIYSLSRVLGVKAKSLSNKLGSQKNLNCVTETKALQNQLKSKKLKQLQQQLSTIFEPRQKKLMTLKQEMKSRHQQQRKSLTKRQKKRQSQELEVRQKRFNKGLKGFWDALTGKKSKIIEQNQKEAYSAYRRDMNERDALVFSQLEEQKSLSKEISKLQNNEQKERLELQQKVFGLENNRNFDNQLSSTPNLKSDFDMSI